jgi:hypothetical protein
VPILIYKSQVEGEDSLPRKKDEPSRGLDFEVDEEVDRICPMNPLLGS